MPRVHVVGAGIAGLACAVALVRAGRKVVLYEAAAQAGGRCRSYHDAKLGCSIDNGNHLLLSANQAVLAYLEEIGTRDTLVGPERAAFPFVDLQTGERWTLEPGAGAVPWWVLSARRRIPGTRLADYLKGLKLAFAGAEDTVADCLDPADPLWPRFWEPLTVAALNTDPREASARLLWRVLKESFAQGEAACRPLIARDGLGPSLVDPALKVVAAAGGALHFSARLRALRLADGRVGELDFGAEQVTLAADDWVVLALPPAGAGELVPDLTVPQDDRPIVNAHIRLPEAVAQFPLTQARSCPLGLVGGTAQWIFLRGEIVSLTVSAAVGLVDEPSEEIARKMWRDTARALDLDPALEPVIRVIKEKRATFAQTPAALARRPPARTAWANLLLAGDWTDTDYPATIESAVRSGRTAAGIVTEL